MKRSSLKFNEYATEIDKAKRIYRAALEAIRRLDDIIKQKKSYRDVFLQESVGLRSKLKDYCERLMFYNPLEYGRKAEEVLWRKVFYDIIQLVKKIRRHVRPNSSVESAYRTHLAAASGYYIHLLFRFQSEFSLKLDGRLDFYLVSDHTSLKRTGSHRKEVSQAARDWAMKACHRCLICLGDLARYQQEFDDGLSMALAERYYCHALTLFPDMGMPHNQLGTLSGSKYYNCDSAYHYIRCLACDKTFEGAHGNLKRLLEKNRKCLQDILICNNHSSGSDTKQSEDVRRFFMEFLSLLDLFYDSSKSYNAHEIQDRCQSSLHNFNMCMFYEPTQHNLPEDEVDHLDDSIVYKIVIMCMATIYLLQKRGSQHFTAAAAFLLALLSHILNHVVIRLQAALYEKNNPNRILQACNGLPDDLVNGVSGLSTDDLDSSSNEATPKKSMQDNSQDSATDKSSSLNRRKTKSKLRDLRRRRRRQTFSEDENSSMSDSDVSEGERHAEDNFISDESEDDLVNYFDHDSDSDISDSHALEEAPDVNGTDLEKPGEVSSNNEWLPNKNLAQFSSELFSSSNSFLDLSNSRCMDSSDTDRINGCIDVMEGRDVPVPPGFDTTVEARHVAEITQKLSNFVIETDTEMSAVPTDTDHSVPTETENDTDEQSSTLDRLETKRKNLLEVLTGEGLLPVVKVMCDWMTCNTGVIKTCAQSSQSLWCRLSVLLNSLPTEKEIVKYDTEVCWSNDLELLLAGIRELDWSQSVPLREDVPLVQFPPLNEVHSNIDFSLGNRGCFSDSAECLLRIGCLRQFGHHLAAFDDLGFVFDEEQSMFLGPSNTMQNSEDGKAAQERMVNAENRRNQLMKDMAQLRLQAEVSQLEGHVESHDKPTFPPYIIPDVSVLCESLIHIRQLSQCGRAIIIIPLSVIDALDVMKKDSQSARDAIRWLEAEFKKGNRYIRAQKSHERGQFHTHNLKKKNKDMWTLLEILDCGRYFTKQSESISSDNMVSILIKRELQTKDMIPLVADFRNSCLKEGISIENIEYFTNKWKSTIKTKG